MSLISSDRWVICGIGGMKLAEGPKPYVSGIGGMKLAGLPGTYGSSIGSGPAGVVGSTGRWARLLLLRGRIKCLYTRNAANPRRPTPNMTPSATPTFAPGLSSGRAWPAAALGDVGAAVVDADILLEGAEVALVANEDV